MKIITSKYIPIYFFISIIIYIFAVYFHATYYLPNGYVEWTSDVDLFRQLSLIPEVTIAEIQKVFSIFLAIFVIINTILIVLIPNIYTNKNYTYRLIYFILILMILPYITIGLLSLYSITVDGGIDGEWLAEGWPISHAYGILFLFLLFIVYINYKERKIL